MLFETERHLPIGKSRWSAAAAEDALRSVLRGAIRDYSKDFLWQSAADIESGGALRTTIYRGGMGVLWALDKLAAYIDDALPFDMHTLADQLYERFFEIEAKAFAEYTVDGQKVPSHWLGESGMLLVMSKLQPSTTKANWQKLLPIVRGNMKNPTMEPLWGGTGSIICALFKLEQEDSPEWRDVLVEHCQFMKDAIIRDNPQNCPIWIQDLYGQKRTLLGAGHGFVGNMYPFIRGGRFLPKNLANWALNDAVECVIKSALVEGECCNWAPSLVPTEGASTKMLMQWCHGRPVSLFL